jgi:omega-6 fatty acid desaturase (delta-12 desaturase)
MESEGVAMNVMGNAEGKVAWQRLISPYARPDLSKSIWQTIDTLVPYVGLFYLTMRSVDISLWLTLPLSILTAGFMARAFIIFHDCGHGSFYESQRANDWLGFITGVLVFTPYHHWRHQHAIHHATSGDLDRRGTGDVYTMTVEEYLDAPWWKKFGYRVMRNPFALFLVGPLILFVIAQRIPPAKGKREIASVWWTNLAIVVMAAALGPVFGWKNYIITQLLILIFGGGVGVWLFYVQHNFEGVYWERHSQWDYFRASMQGSSFYRLPAILQWFTGNIGFHHIHHLGSTIPNYNLARAYRENAVFQVRPLTLLSSLRCLRWRLYDEANRRLAGWDVLKQQHGSASHA